jgi:hypothetical protein
LLQPVSRGGLNFPGACYAVQQVQEAADLLGVPLHSSWAAAGGQQQQQVMKIMGAVGESCMHVDACARQVAGKPLALRGSGCVQSRSLFLQASAGRSRCSTAAAPCRTLMAMPSCKPRHQQPSQLVRSAWWWWRLHGVHWSSNIWESAWHQTRLLESPQGLMPAPQSPAGRCIWARTSQPQQPLRRTTARCWPSTALNGQPPVAG